MSGRASSKRITNKRPRDSSALPETKPRGRLVLDAVVLPYPKNRYAVSQTSTPTSSAPISPEPTSLVPNPPAPTSSLPTLSTSTSYTNAEAYAPSRYGEMGDYMRRKRLKLQVQNTEVASQQDGKPQIFKNIRVYVRSQLCSLLWANNKLVPRSMAGPPRLCKTCGG